MQFLNPIMLWSLLLLPLMLAGYLWLLRRKRQQVVTFSAVSWILQNMDLPSPWRRHIPPALMGLAVALLLFASARPMARVTLPADYMTLIMAMDVSRSMLAEDVDPSRIKAAQKAAKEFLQDLPKNVRVGIVSFAGNAQVVQHVSQDKDELVAAIDRFQLQRGTATGSGLLLALSTLRPEAPIDLEAALYNTNPFGYSDQSRQGQAGGSKSLDASLLRKNAHPNPLVPLREALLFYCQMDDERLALTPWSLQRKQPIWGCVFTPSVSAHPMVLFRAMRVIHFSLKSMRKP